MIKKILLVLVALGLVFSITACTSEPESNAQSKGQAETEEAFKQQSEAVPYPKEQLKNSLERKNLSERLLRTNKPDALGFVTLFAFDRPIGYYSVKGKVSSTQSQMTTDQLIVKQKIAGEWHTNVVNAPGDDGTYGPNEEGVFFFTTEGTFVTTSLDYIWSDQPLPLDVPDLDK